MEHQARMDASRRSSLMPCDPRGEQRHSPQRAQGFTGEIRSAVSSVPLSFVFLCALCGSLTFGQAQVAQSQAAGESSSSQKSPKRRHTTVAEEDPASSDISKAEDLIQKQDYSSAEQLLRKSVANDAQNHVAWFYLGFVENALGKTE